MFKGAGANILRGVAGAGVLSLYDKLQEVMFGKVYSGGKPGCLFRIVVSNELHQDPVKCFNGIVHCLYSHPLRSPLLLDFYTFLFNYRPVRYRCGYPIKDLVQNALRIKSTPHP